MACVLRLPTTVHVTLLSCVDTHGISRFSRKVLPYMLRVFDHAGSTIPRQCGMVGVAFCFVDHIGTRDITLFAAQ